MVWEGITLLNRGIYSCEDTYGFDHGTQSHVFKSRALAENPVLESFRSLLFKEFDKKLFVEQMIAFLYYLSFLVRSTFSPLRDSKECLVTATVTYNTENIKAFFPLKIL